MKSDKNALDIALPGGLIALGTTLDPSLGKADRLVGQIIGLPGHMPPVFQKIIVSYVLVDRVSEDGKTDKIEAKIPFKMKDTVKLNIGSQTTEALVRGLKADLVQLILAIPCCADLNTRVAISTKSGTGRWSLAGMGMIVRGQPVEGA